MIMMETMTLMLTLKMIMIGVDDNTNNDPVGNTHNSGVDTDDCKIFGVDDNDNSGLNADNTRLLQAYPQYSYMLFFQYNKIAM